MFTFYVLLNGILRQGYAIINTAVSETLRSMTRIAIYH